MRISEFVETGKANSNNTTTKSSKEIWESIANREKFPAVYNADDKKQVKLLSVGKKSPYIDDKRIDIVIDKLTPLKNLHKNIPKLIDKLEDGKKLFRNKEGDPKKIKQNEQNITNKKKHFIKC